MLVVEDLTLEHDANESARLCARLSLILDWNLNISYQSRNDFLLSIGQPLIVPKGYVTVWSNADLLLDIYSDLGRKITTAAYSENGGAYVNSSDLPMMKLSPITRRDYERWWIVRPYPSPHLL